MENAKGKSNVIFYGAGNEAKYCILQYKKHGITPVCFCDRDEKKIGKKICGFECYSLEEALERYPDADMIITPRFPLRFHIMEELLNNGILTKERILNYEPYEKRKSCFQLCGFMDLHFSKEMRLCYCTFLDSEHPYLEFNGNMESSLEKLWEYKNDLLQKINDNEKVKDTPCSNCPNLIEDYWPLDTRYRHVAYSAGGGCQFNCQYCFTPARHHMIEETWEKDASLSQLIEEMEKSDMIHPDAMLEIGPGEVTVISKRHEMYEQMRKYYTLILTNAGVYSEEIAELVKDRARLLVSIDAGTKETFKAIKGVDVFDKVVENLKRYVNNGALLEIKYIFMSGVNDNKEDVEGFVNLAKELQVSNIIISHDYRDAGEELHDTENMIEMMRYMLAYAKQKQVETIVASGGFNKDDLKRIME